MKIGCETCDSRLECLGNDMDKGLCKVAHESLHKILLEYCRRFKDVAVADVTMIETHQEKVDTPEEETIQTTFGVELIPLRTGQWQVESKWGRLIVDDGEKQTKYAPFDW